jgi:transcriptional regulator of acetoin/glycerol metabolism
LVQRLDAHADGVAPVLVCASRDALRTLVDGARLREDLCNRLNGLTLRVPALRERSDLLELAHAIVAQEVAGKGLELADDVVALLRAHRWPGNLRQLCNVLRAAVALTAGERTVTHRHLSDDFVDEALVYAATAAATAAPNAAAPPTPTQSLDALTLEAITQAVDAVHGNISEASRRLGISRNTIYRKLRWNPRH